MVVAVTLAAAGLGACEDGTGPGTPDGVEIMECFLARATGGSCDG